MKSLSMRTLRAVLVGAGAMGKAWARAVEANNDVDLVGWVDLVKERAAEAAAEFGLAGVLVGDDLETALGHLQPDFVLDVAVPEAHHAVTACCLARGVPVLGEKPMAATMDEARDLLARSEATGTLFVVSQNRRYNAGLAALRDLVTTELGELGQLNAEFYRAPHFGGFREDMDSPLLLDMAIHTFDAARYLTGADPVSVSCTEFNPPWSWYRGAASAVADFELTGGIHFSYQGSWCALGHETSWDSSWRVVGALGSASWDGTSNPTAEVVNDQQQIRRIAAHPATLAGEGINGSLADFVDGLRNNHSPMSEAHDNIKSLAMVNAALESSRIGRRVPVALHAR